MWYLHWYHTYGSWFMWISPLYLTFLFELCLLGLASFLRALLIWTFWRFYSKGGECETKASQWFQSGKRQAMCEHRKRRSKKGEVWSRGSLDGGKHLSKCKWFYICQFLQNYVCVGCVVINHQKGEIVANMAHMPLVRVWFWWFMTTWSMGLTILFSMSL
jgi:hypothetical protein